MTPHWKTKFRQTIIGSNLETVSSKRGATIESFIEHEVLEPTFNNLITLLNKYRSQLPEKHRNMDRMLAGQYMAVDQLLKDVEVLKSEYITEEK